MLLNIKLREDILKHFPNFEYYNCKEPEKINFFRADNIVGEQQESFLLFHILEQLKNFGGIGIDIGCGQAIHFGCVGINDYFGFDHPKYHGEYYPHVTSLAENISIFNEGTFSWIIASHILEHLEDPASTFRKWLNLLRQNGIIILVMPDSRYEDKSHPWDPDHKVFFTPDDFEKQIIIPNKDLLQTEVFNDFSNSFSFNYVGRKI